MSELLVVQPHTVCVRLADVIRYLPMQELKRILLTGGGTAGHVNPALAIGSALGCTGARYLYVGVRGRMEEEVVPREGIPVRFVRSAGYPGARPSLALARFLFEIFVGTLQSAVILLTFRPEVIIGTGGYASAPVIIASALLSRLRLSRTPVFIHEQNAAPGKLNQLMGRFAEKVFVTFSETLEYFPRNGVHTGYPLRGRIHKLGGEERKGLDFVVPKDRKVVLVFGGSQGSRTINRAVIDSLRYFLPHRNRLFLIHGMGLNKSRSYHAAEDTEARLRRTYSEEELRQIETFYLARPFFHEIEQLYAVSNLVVVRGGAGSLNEVSAMGLPAIIIPKSNLPGDHQVMNARAMERSGGAEILYEEISLVKGQIDEIVEGKKLAERILSLLENESRLMEMSRLSGAFLRQDAVAEITRQIHATLQGVAIMVEETAHVRVERKLPNNRALLAKLEQAYKELQTDYSPEAVIQNPDDLAYFKNRAASLLIRVGWEDRNVGVKLLGLLRATDKIPLLLTTFRDRRPASLLKRIFGGDYEQVGFIRRNIIATLARLNELTPEVEAALLLAFQDPYYEVRAEAIRAAAHFGGRISMRQEFVSALLRLVRDRNTEVAAAAAEALGKLGDEEVVLPTLLSMKHYKYWKVRAAALKGICSLVERGMVTDHELLSRELPGFILTATDFMPQFEIKSEYRRLMEAVSNGKASKR
ncbi:MAG TPA: glycosyltransferase [Acidobacteriota bacterium]|nr:glycosyltransferase [Acidobacteriota bacterium]